MSNPFAVAANRRALRHGSGTSPQASFAGAMHNRLYSDWVLAAIKSADQEVRQNLKTLKSRSRELGRNNPHASRYLDIKADNVIGEEGIQLQATTKDESGNLLQSVNQRIEDAWNEWGEVGSCTVDRKSGWRDVERLVVQEEARDGDALLRLVPAWRGNRFGMALQLIDSDQLDVDFSEPASRDARGNRRNEIRMGVEIDEWGAPVAFHLYGAHPSEPGGRDSLRQRVPADQIVHWFRPYRVGQSRGVPDFAPVLLTQKMLAGYEEAEITAARIASAKGGFFERAPDAVDLSALLGETKDVSRFTMEVEPGLFESLPPGWKFAQWDPKHPSNAFPDFHKAMLRTIATGLGANYNVLAQDLEGVTFSSIRHGMLAERETWKVLQGMVWRHVHQQVYRTWLTWALTTGALDLPTRDPLHYRKVKWQPRGWDWVDPLKDAQSSAMEVRLGVNSRTRIAAAKGRNYEDVLEEIAYEEELARSMGVEISTDMSRSGGGRDSGRDAQDEDEGEEDAAARTSPLDRAPSNRIAQLLHGGERARTGRGRLLLGNGNGRNHGTHEG